MHSLGVYLDLGNPNSCSLGRIIKLAHTRIPPLPTIKTSPHSFNLQLIFIKIKNFTTHTHRLLCDLNMKLDLAPCPHSPTPLELDHPMRLSGSSGTSHRLILWIQPMALGGQ